MGLESTTVISGLDGTWPTGIDKVNNGDDHLRLIKNVLKAQFPGTGGVGFAIPITATEEELNYSVGVTSAIQAQIDAVQADVDANEAVADLGLTPIGGIIMYNAVFANIPANWQLCDGTNGTPDMTDQFVYGTNTEVELLDAGGSADAVVVDHGHASAGAHTHTSNSAEDNSANGSTTTHCSRSPSGTVSTNSAGAHTHANAGVSGTDANLPPFIKLAFIQRIT